MLHKTYLNETKTAEGLNENVNSLSWQQVALMEQQKYSVFLVTAVNKAALSILTLL